MRVVIGGASVLSLLLVAGSAAAQPAESRSATGLRLEARSSPAVAVRRPRVRYLYGTVGLEPTTLVFASAIDTGGAPTTYYVEYGPTPSFGSRTPEQTLPAAACAGAPLGFSSAGSHFGWFGGMRSLTQQHTGETEHEHFTGHFSPV